MDIFYLILIVPVLIAWRLKRRL